MKAGIHPNYKMVQVTCACGNTFETGSVKKEIRVETCSECHPFYTGRQKFAEAGGRVDRFNKKYGFESPVVFISMNSKWGRKQILMDADSVSRSQLLMLYACLPGGSHTCFIVFS